MPALSTTTPRGRFSCADVAGPPSPLSPAVPLPATVLMLPSAATLRTRWLFPSVMKRRSASFTAKAYGPFS